MELPILAICHNDGEYLNRLSAAMMAQKNFMFSIRLYTSTGWLLKKQSEEVAILLISEQLHEQKFMQVPKNTYLILSNTQRDTMDEIPCIYQFNRTERMVQRIYEFYEDAHPCITSVRNYHTKLIGVYSPIKRCYQTTFALTLGQVLAQSTNTLYLNLEGYPGFQGIHFQDYEYHLTDLIYLLKNAPTTISGKLNSMMQTINGLDFIPPCDNNMDLRKIEGEDLCKLIEVLATSKEYGYLILDLSDCVQDLYELLNMCDEIYTITANDPVSNAKIQEYESSLEQMHYGSVLQHTRKMVIPTFSKNTYEAKKLLYGDLAEYVKNELKDVYDEIV